MNGALVGRGLEAERKIAAEWQALKKNRFRHNVTARDGVGLPLGLLESEVHITAILRSHRVSEVHQTAEEREF